MVDSGMSLLEIYAVLLAIGLVLMFAVLVVIMFTAISINKNVKKLSEKTPVEEKNIVPEEATPVKNKQTGLAQKNHCSMCGNEVREGAVFCDTCGSRM